MEIETSSAQGVAGLKKHDLKPISIAFMLYSLVAAGAFGVEEMIPQGGPGLTIAVLVIFAFIWALPISNFVAEMGSILPSEGGLYVWTQKAFGEFWGFQSGWWLTMATYLSNAAFVMLIIGYSSQLFSMTPEDKFMMKVAVILIFTLINLLGIREVSIVTNLLSVIILAAFLFVTIVGFANWQHNPVAPFIPEDKNIFESLGSTIGICIWMYCGYECIANVAGEIKNPQVIPKGLLLAMPIIALSYVLPTIAGLASVGPWYAWSTEGGGIGGSTGVGYANVLMEYLGPVFGYFFLIVAILSQCSIFNTYIAAGSRGFFVMADDYLFPRSIIKVSKKRGVPYIGVLSVSIVTIIMTQFEFAFLVTTTSIFMIAVYLCVALTVLKLRKIYPVSERKGLYVIPGGKASLYVCIVSVIGICIFSFIINGTDYLLIGLIGMLTGPVFYVVFKIRYGGMARKEPDTYLLNPNTKMAAGDTVRISIFMIAVGVVSFFGQFFLVLYEGAGGEEKYLEAWGSGLFSDFWGMISVLKTGGATLLVVGLVMYFICRRWDFPDMNQNNLKSE